MRHLAGSAVALVLAAAAGPALADARLEFTTQGACPTHFRAIDVAGPRLRIELEPPGGEPLVSIFDGDEDLVTTLIPSQRRFMRIEADDDAADYAGDVVTSSMTHMDKQLAKAQEVMREQCKRGQCPQIPGFESMMGTGRGPVDPITTRDTGEAGSADGIACTWREWVRAEGVVRRECLADIATLPMGDRDRAGLRRGMRVMLNFGKSMGAFRDRFLVDADPDPPMGKLRVAQVCFAGGVESGRATATVVQASVDPLRFEVPADYVPAMGPGSGTQ
jgi:hypothetical protein